MLLHSLEGLVQAHAHFRETVHLGSPFRLESGHIALHHRLICLAIFGFNDKGACL